MKKILVLQLTLLLLSVYAFATPISESEAREKALRFIHSKKGTSAARSAQRFGGAASLGASLTNVESREAYYVFNVDSVNGYVIVSGDDRMPDVLGYSYHGTYNAEDIPDNMRAWLQGYADEYQYLQTHGDARGASLTAVKGDAVLPLLECTWSQHFPYNDLCPNINGKNAVTGCVATAMAQVMYYHKWPKQTTKVIPAYTTKTAGISMPQIGITTIDWDNMAPSYGYYGGTDVQNQAIAELMLLCGCAVQMDYGLESDGGSGAGSSPNAFTDYFGYDKISISKMFRNRYDSDIWNQMIYDEVKEGRPVMYSGYRSISAPGHQFVIDGYDENDYFHVNWGWGGYLDCYFLLSSLNGYDSGQSAIIGIEIEGSGDANRKYAYAELVGNTLTFYYDNKRETRAGTMFNVNNFEWTSDEYKSKITTVRFDSSFGDYRYMSDTGFMFSDMANLTSIQGLKYFDTQSVIYMRGMFYGCSKLKSLDVSNFNTQNVTDMGGMFYGCSILTSLDVSNFNTKNVADMSYMFLDCNNLTSLDVSNFNTQNVTDMSGMFYGCRKLTSLNLSNFDTQDVTDMRYMFYGCSSLKTIYADKKWSIQNVESGNDMFSGCYILTGEKGTQYSYSKTDYTYAHIDGGTDDPGYFTSYSYPYIVISSDNKTLTLYYGNGRNVPGSIRIKTYSNYKDRDWNSVAIFLETVVFDKSFADYNDITNTSYWFYNCENLTLIQGLEYLNTQNVTDMRYMFGYCENLISLDVSNFDMQNVTSMDGMFNGCSSLTSLDVHNFNTQNVTNMYCLFYNCENLISLDISNFDTQNVTNMGYMFCGCSSLQTIYAGGKWDTENVENSAYMFAGCNELVGQDGTEYDNKYQDKAKAHYGADGYLTYKSPVLRGDANGDGEIGMPDVMFIVNYILGSPDASFNTKVADANHDGEVGMPDVMFIVNYILNGEFPKE